MICGVLANIESLMSRPKLNVKKNDNCSSLQTENGRKQSMENSPP